MATLQELEAERERRSAAPTQFGQRVEASITAAPDVPTVGGVPEFDAIPVSQRPGGFTTSAAPRLQELEAERARRDAALPDPRISTTPVRTGVREIDFAGQDAPAFSILSPTLSKPEFEAIPAIESREFDDPIRLKAERAAEGVDFMTGLPVIQRIKIATTPNVPRLRSEKIAQVMGAEFAQIPDDLPKFRYDQTLGEFQFLRPDETQPGNFRWTSLDGSGLELGDLGDLLNLGEIGSLTGSVLGAGKGKLLTFGKLGQRGQAAVGAAGGGGLGRAIGEGSAILINWMQGGDLPTQQELSDLGWDGAQIEAFASILGELGAAGLRVGSTLTQAGAARAAGRQGVADLSPTELAQANRNIQETREDLTRIRDALGREDLPVTQGTASHSIEMIADESHAFRAANKATQQEFNKAQARGVRTTQDYINEVWGGNNRFLGDKAGLVRAANDAVGTNGRIVVAQTEDGLIHFAPKAAPEEGLRVVPRTDFWQVNRTGLPKSLQGTGLGQDIYKTAAAEAQSYGKVLVSDIDVTDDALEGIWRQIDGDEVIGKLEWNPDVTRSLHPDGKFHTVSNDGISPVVRMAERESVTSELIQQFSVPAPGVGGRLVANKEMKRVLRKPGKREWAGVVADIKTNPIARHQMKEAAFADYAATVNKNGKFSINAFENWKLETGKQLEDIFTETEMRALRKPGNFRPMMEAASAKMNQNLDALSKAIDIDRGSLKFNEIDTIFNQLVKLPQKKRLRSMRILDSMDMGDAVRAEFRDDLRLQLQKITKGADAAGFEQWFKNNQDAIRDITGNQEYINHLRTVGNILKRRSDRGLVAGSGPEIQTTMLGLFRVIFGPLSRAQRFLSAAKKGTTRVGAAKASQLITDPDKLRSLIAIRAFPVGSRRAARIMQDTGVVDMIWPEGQAFDVESEDDRREIARIVNVLLQDELNE